MEAFLETSRIPSQKYPKLGLNFLIKSLIVTDLEEVVKTSSSSVDILRMESNLANRMFFH